MTTEVHPMETEAYKHPQSTDSYTVISVRGIGFAVQQDRQLLPPYEDDEQQEALD